MNNNLDLEILKQRIIEVFNEYKIDISLGQVDKLVLFAELLLCENEKYNLTRITSIEDIVYKHFLDSAYLIHIMDKQQAAQTQANENKQNSSIISIEQNNSNNNNINNNTNKEERKDIKRKLLDIGSGAGFPGIVLAILTDMQITLVESTGKKANFLEMVKRKLKLENVIVINNRVENMRCFSSFDYATARALADLKTIIKYSWPFLRKGGFLLAQKGPKYVEEIKEVNLNKKGIQLVDTEKYLIQDLTRYVLVIQKQ